MKISINTEKQKRDQAKERIAELQTKLSKTDFKFSQDYDKKDTQEWLQLKSDRQAWRDEIRQLEQSLEA